MSARRAKSRVVRKEKERLMRQTILFGGLAVVVTLVFVYLILPGFIRLVDSFLDNSNPFETSDTIPPQIPVFNPPADAVSESKLSLNGFGEPESEIVIMLNGPEYARTVVAEDGTFTVDITLEEGENIIAAYAKDKADNESAVTRSYIVTLDKQAPLIVVDSPQDGAEIVSRANQNLEIKGSTEVGSRVFINDRLVLPDSEGNFRYTMMLKEGNNEIKIKAEDKAGNTGEAALSVKFSL